MKEDRFDCDASEHYTTRLNPGGKIEHAVRSIAGIGDEFEIILITNADRFDVVTMRVEHHAGDEIAAAVTEEIHALRSARGRRGFGARYAAAHRVQGGVGQRAPRQTFGSSVARMSAERNPPFQSRRCGGLPTANPPG